MLSKNKILSINAQFASPQAREQGLYGGVGYYRQRMAARYLKQFTFVYSGNEFLVDKDKLKDLVAERVRGMSLVHTQRVDNPHLIVALLGACDFYNIPLIVDSDDHVFSTDGLAPENHTYENTEHKHYLEVLLKEATALTVSTQPLVDLYKPYNKNIYHLPNAVDPKDWKFQSRHHERVTVGWAGSASHAKDHTVLEDVYPGVVEKNPDVVFSFVGHMLPEHIKNLKRRNWEIKPGISWWEGNKYNDMTYPRLLAEQGYDVGLAPLIESQFNSSRSLAKWFEYTMVGIPTVCSEWGPYLNLRDGEDAYLVQTKDGWVEAINHLIQNKNDRTRLITTARERILSEYTVRPDSWGEIFNSYIGHGFKS